MWSPAFNFYDSTSTNYVCNVNTELVYIWKGMNKSVYTDVWVITLLKIYNEILLFVDR